MKKNKKKYFGKDLTVQDKEKNQSRFSKNKAKASNLTDSDFLENEETNSDFTNYDEFSADYIANILKKANRPLRLDDILRFSKMSRRSKKEVLSILQELVSKGKVIRLQGASYMLNQRVKTIIGKVMIQRSGSAFISPLTSDKISNMSDQAMEERISASEISFSEKFNNDIFVPKDALNNAWNGDIVEVNIVPPKRISRQRELKPEGIITGIIKRGQDEFTVRLERLAEKQMLKHIKPQKSAFIAIPIDSRYDFNVLVPDFDPSIDNIISTQDEINKKNDKLQVGDLIVIKIEKQLPSNTMGNLWLAKPIRILGNQNNVSVQESIAKLGNAVPMNFPDDVLNEAKQIAMSEGFQYTDLDGENLKNQVKIKENIHDFDLRNYNFVTIDGADSKDFDDAIFVKKNEHGWQLMVAIADVARYVKPFSKLDKEAKSRGNSYYFPNSVEPMLPEFLSNGLCSLRPNEDHAVMFAKIVFGENGIVQKTSFGQGIISSKARLTYEAVQELFDTGKAEHAPFAKNLTSDVQEMLQEAKNLALVLIERRKKAGNLHLEIPEPRCIVESDRIVDIGSRKNMFAHQLIEAFMVAANEAVAEFLTAKNAFCIYRVHPEPSQEKLERLKSIILSTNISEILPKKKIEKQGSTSWLNEILNSLQKLKSQKVSNNQENDNSYLVHRLVLRSMMQARYSPVLEKHFGLASNCYSHFTSPIRRYSDLIVHRVLKNTLGINDGEKNSSKTKNIYSQEALLEIADNCNECERKAFQAEREVFKRLACLFLENKIGQEFQAIISGVNNFGIFCEMIGFLAEGMVRIEYLGDDYYIYDEEAQSLTGERTGIQYKLGDFLTIKVESVDISRLEINFSIVGVRKRNKSNKARQNRKNDFKSDNYKEKNDFKRKNKKFKSKEKFKSKTNSSSKRKK